MAKRKITTKTLAGKSRYNQGLIARTDAEIAYPTKKCCVKCGATKSADEFSRHRVSKDGLRSRCKICLALQEADRLTQAGRSKRMNLRHMERIGLEVAAPSIETTPTGPIMRVPLAGGSVAIIDAEDWHLVRTTNWSLAKKTGYATGMADVDGEQKKVLMHRVIASAPDGLEIDHWDHNKLNNRRANLRFATRAQNGANLVPYKGPKTSSFRGVSLNNRGLWVAQIRHLGVSYRLGSYTDEVKAARVYDQAARERFKEFAVLNFET